MNQPEVLVIGAGVAGLAASIRLAAAGCKVTVFESNPYPGGKLSEIRLGAYRFDAGPSLFTMPHFVDELYELCQLDPRQFFRYQKLDIITRYFYEDGTVINAYSEPEHFAEEIAKKTNEPAQRVEQFLQHSKMLYELTAPVFLYNSLHRWETYLNRKAIKALFSLHQLDMMRSLHRANSATFSDARVIQLFDRFATYNGSNPYCAPATLKVIPHLEHHIGAYYPEGGMYTIALSLYRLACALGVQFFFQTPVELIVVRNKRACAVRVNGLEHPADAIVCNMDVGYAYRKLLPGIPLPRSVKREQLSSSAIIFYWGVRNTFPALHLHNIFFSNNYKAEFEHIFHRATIYHDPTIYVNITAKWDTADAPPGCENWFVMINAPHHQNQSWSEMVALARANVLNKLKRQLGVELDRLIEAEEVLDPLRLEARTTSYKGALYGSNSNSPLAAFFRHPNFLRHIKGLYFCGGSVHPGGGIPLSLLSAQITANLIKHYLLNPSD